MSFSTFFSKLQESPWYREFLNPVIDEVENNTRILDIGTGSGKMLQLLFEEKAITGVGTDTDEGMLEEAKKKLANTSIELKQIDAGANYPFEDNSFDSVTICSVLFNIKEEDDRNQLMGEALRVLKKNGKLIVLTPTGAGNIIKLTTDFFSFKNKGIYVWYNATKIGAKRWTKEQYLQNYATTHQLAYQKTVTLKGFAQVETIIK
jgi:ubiquinone/menaquinone biosynthesis C-methylase UbiE